MDKFMRLVRVVEFLATSDNKNDKVLEIKMLRDDGIISDEEALELALEFC